MNDPDPAWARTETTARRLAGQKALLCVPLSRTVILRIICRQQDANVSPADALEYLAMELVRLRSEQPVQFTVRGES
jgi:hypothetical protein